MNKTALATFSFFDSGSRPSGEELERFYHGFVLGLMVELENRYMITSNREKRFWTLRCAMLSREIRQMMR
ncbi:MAG: hypothetical protein ACLTKE_11090 [Coprococcus sp.]